MIRKHLVAGLALGTLALVATGCAENLSSPSAVEQGPRFLRWATPTQFEFQGMTAVRSPLAASVTQTPPLVDRVSSAHGKMAPLSWSHTVGTGSNPLLVVGVSVSTGKTVTSVTYRGAALTYLGDANNSQAGMRAELWYLKAPAPGTGTVSVSVSGKTEVVGGAVSFFGTDQFAPFGSVVSASSNSTTASVATASGASDLVISVLVIGGSAASRTPAAGQTELWDLYSSVISGGASAAAGGGSVTMGWTASSAQPWALAAAAIKPAPAGVALAQTQATFWAKRGESRAVQINYAANGGTAPFLKLTVSDPTYVPGIGNLAVGDSVLVTATVDPIAVTVSLEPHQTQFGTPAQLQIWYGGAGGDLNGDGVVDAGDTYIENQLLGMWYQADPTTSWTPITATQSLGDKSFTASLAHFSGY
ncbi:MAG TPA: hypothetical protein VI297_00880, partial [Gemmatimonadales bacterium]